MRSFLLVSAVSAASDQNSPSFDLQDLEKYSIHVDYSGSDLAGTLKLQCSDDNSDWIDVANSSQAITAAASHLWNVTNAAYQYVRVNWDRDSGTGNWTVTAKIKENLVKTA